MLETVGVIVAPAALVTSLLFYFGWVRTRAQAAYFGLDPSILQYTTEDYVFRSIGSIYWPLVALLVAGLVAVGVVAVTASLIRRGDALLLLAFGVSILVVGTSFLVYGVYSLWWPPNVWNGRIVAPLCLTAAVPITAWGARVADAARRHSTPSAVERGSRPLRGVAVTLLALLAVVFLFWTVGD